MLESSALTHKMASFWLTIPNENVSGRKQIEEAEEQIGLSGQALPSMTKAKGRSILMGPT